MATTEENAKALMRALIRRPTQVGDLLRPADIQKVALAAGLGRAAQDEAITFAGYSKWIEDVGNGFYAMTRNGWDNGNA